MSLLVHRHPERTAAPAAPAGAAGAVSDEPVLRLRGLAKRFGELRVLRGVDFDVRRGELLALIGENGSGKSTIVKCIAGTLTPEGGTILLDGHPVGAGLTSPQFGQVAVVWQ